MRSKKVSAVLRLGIIPAVVLLAVVVAWKGGYFELDRRDEMRSAIERLRALPGSEIVFVAAYVVVVAASLPAAMATIVGGALFGPWLGAVLSWAALMVATAVTHLLARHVARRPMEKLFGEHRMLKRLRDHDNVLTLWRLRILPVAPFAVLSYVAGVAGVSLRRLAVASALGTIHSVVAYAYVGDRVLAGMLSPADGANRAFWVAGAVTAVMLLLSLVPLWLRNRD